MFHWFKRGQRFCSSVAKLSKQLAVVDADYQLAEKGRVKHKEELAEITDKHEKLTLESERKIAPEEYARVVGQCKRYYNHYKWHYEDEIKVENRLIFDLLYRFIDLSLTQLTFSN